MQTDGQGAGTHCAEILRWPLLPTVVWGTAMAVGLSCPACHAEVFPGWEAAQGGSRQLRWQAGDLLAFQPGLGPGQGPWLLFCKVPSRWRRGFQELVYLCAEPWFLSRRPTFRRGKSLERETLESLLTSLRPFFFLISFPASGSEND